MNHCPKQSLFQVVVAQVGARMHYAVPVILNRAGMLAQFYTDAYAGPGSILHAPAKLLNLLPEAWKFSGLLRLLGRQAMELPADKITAFNWLGMRFALRLKCAHDPHSLEEHFLEYASTFCKKTVNQKFPKADAVYAFDPAAAVAIFQKAKEQGMYCFLEKYGPSMQVVSQILSEEHQRWAGWEAPYPSLPCWIARSHLDEEGTKLADTILCPSDFVSQGLEALGVSRQKIKIQPYGIDISRFHNTRLPWDGRRPLRILFVGNVGLEKGVQYLQEALGLLGSRSLQARIVGPHIIKKPYLQELLRTAELTGPVPRSKVLEHYTWADLFVFPGLAEGSATVTYEALAAGLPVITTLNSGSVVRSGVDGFIVPIRDPVALAEKIELLLGKPELLNWMSHNARQRAEEHSWEKYGERLVALIQSQLALSK